MNTKAVKMWLIKNDLTQTQLAKELGITIQAVNQTIHNWRRSRTVRAHLLRKGCPEKYLGKPQAPRKPRAKAKPPEAAS